MVLYLPAALTTTRVQTNHPQYIIITMCSLFCGKKTTSSPPLFSSHALINHHNSPQQPYLAHHRLLPGHQPGSDSPRARPGPHCDCRSRRPIDHMPTFVGELTHHSRVHHLILDVTSPYSPPSFHTRRPSAAASITSSTTPGYAVLGSMEEVPLEDYRQQMETNFFGPIRLMQAVLSDLRSRKCGCVINVSSGADKGVYSANKFALDAVNEALCKEMEGFRIRMAVLVPGAFQPGLWREVRIVCSRRRYGGAARTRGTRRDTGY